MGDKKIRTIFSSKDDDEGEREFLSDEEEPGQEFFVGGSQNSGQQVVGPPRAQDWAANFFEKLHSTEHSFALPASSAEESGILRHTLEVVIFNNGFLMDGRFVRADDPEFASLKQCLMDRTVPESLKRKYPGKAIKIMVKRTREDFNTKNQQPFFGEGQRLGDLVVPVVGADTGEQETPAAQQSSQKTEEYAEALKRAQDSVGLRDGEPLTNINIRLPNGNRVAGRFNHNHTVFDVRSFIMSWKLTELIGLDKVFKGFKVLRGLGGVRAAIKKRYLMDETRIGTLVGEDEFGNKYYEDTSYFVPRSRWIDYAEYRWLDYDGSQIPAEWYRWLHHMTDKTPTEYPAKLHKWSLPHKENLSLIESEKYIPYSTTRTKITGWQPKEKS